VNKDDGNLALGKTAVQIATTMSATNAVDSDTTTMSCTDELRGQPWWAVDLGQEYSIDKVVITMPHDNTIARNCPSSFIHFYRTTLC